MNIDMTEGQAKLIKRAAWLLPIGYLVFCVVGFPLVNVEKGHTGVDLFYGKAIGTRSAGWSFKLPLVDVVQIDNQPRTTKFDKEESPTHDLQVATIDLNSQWSILPAGSMELYNYFGDETAVEEALIKPGLLEEQKALSAKYDAYDLQQKAPAIAEEAKKDLHDWLTASLKLHDLPNDLDVSTVLFPQVSFSPQFYAATTELTKTQQSIGTFENQRSKTVTDADAARDAAIRSANATAHQIRVDADAEAAGITAKALALKQNPNLLCYLVQKGWNGVLPEVSNGGSPFPFAEVCKK